MGGIVYEGVLGIQETRGIIRDGSDLEGHEAHGYDKLTTQMEYKITNGVFEKCKTSTMGNHQISDIHSKRKKTGTPRC